MSSSRRARRRVREPRRHRPVRAVVTLITVGVVMASIGVGSAYAVHDFEMQLDGNTVDDAAATADFDWQSFFNSSGAPSPALPDATRPGFTASGFVPDHFDGGADPTTFSTGSKDTLDIAGWQCGVSNNVGDKVDIVNAYSTVYTVPSGSDAGETILYFGVEKASPNGSSNIAVWFLQDGTVDCSSNGGNVTFEGHHQDGDLLVVSEFTNGGVVANVRVYEWQGGADGSLPETPVATGGTCGGGGSDEACAIANADPVDPPWPHPDKNTKQSALGANQFFEGGVNLNEAGIAEGCFGRFLANTRSAPSLTATIFDFAAGELEICAPSTTLSLTTNPATPSGATGPTVHGGDDVTITFTELNDGINPLTSPSVTTDQASCTPVYASGDAGVIGTLDVGESWVFTCTINDVQNSLTINAVGHGLDPLGRDVTWAAGCVNDDDVLTAPDPDVFCDSGERAAVTITVIEPSTSLTKTASVTVTYTYTETNDSGDGTELTRPTAGWVTDDQCAPVTEVLGSNSDGLPSDATHNLGDADNDGKLDDGETFTLRCTDAATTDGSNVDVTNRAIGHGIDPLGFDITWCASIANKPPAAAPGTAVKCDPEEADEVRVRVDHLARPAQGA